MSKDFEDTRPMAWFLSLMCGVLAVSMRSDWAAGYILTSAALAMFATWVGTETQ